MTEVSNAKIGWMNYLKSNLFSILTAIPIIFVAIGAMIINIRLGQFGVIDFPVFDSRTIFVGFIGLLQILGYSILWVLFISWNGKLKEIPLIMINAIWKPALMAIIVWQYCTDFHALEGFSYLSWDFNVGILVNQSEVMVLGFVVILLGKEYWSNDVRKDPLGVLTVVVGALLILIAMRSVVLLVLFVPELRSIFLSYFYTSLGFMVFVLTRWGMNRDRNKGIEPKVYPPFSENSILKALNPFFYFFLAIILAMLFLYNYSTLVYPLSKINAGGGKYVFTKIELKDNSTIKGQIIHSNNSYIYILDSTKSLTQYGLDEIRRYSVK